MSSPSGAHTLIQWRLLGNRNWLNGQFARVFSALTGKDTRWGASYQAVVTNIADLYQASVMARWEEEHDRTGETLGTFEHQFTILSPFEAQVAIHIGGNVGFVINPLPPHVIGDGGAILAGPNPVSSHYGDFGPVHGPIEWYQGGPESRSPDMTWYQDPVEALAGIGVAGLQKVAGVVKEEVLGLTAIDGELSSGLIEMNWDL